MQPEEATTAISTIATRSSTEGHPSVSQTVPVQVPDPSSLAGLYAGIGVVAVLVLLVATVAAITAIMCIVTNKRRTRSLDVDNELKPPISSKNGDSYHTGKNAYELKNGLYGKQLTQYACAWPQVFTSYYMYKGCIESL